MNHNIKTLPKWAQKMISDREQALLEIEQKITALEQVNYICKEMNWFNLGYNTQERRGLFILDKDKPVQVCCIGAGAVLLVGHKRKNGANT